MYQHNFANCGVLWLTVVAACSGCGLGQPREPDVGVRRTELVDSHVMLLTFKKAPVALFWANPSTGGLPGIYNDRQCGATFVLPQEHMATWESTVVDGRVTSLTIDDKPYDIQKGNCFLVLYRDGTTTVEQLSVDLAAAIPSPEDLTNSKFADALQPLAMQHEQIRKIVIGKPDP